MRLKIMPPVIAALALASSACGDGTGPSSLAGTFALVAENGQPLPADPSAPDGCCLTLSGSLVLTSTAYQLRITYRNKNNDLTFENEELGTWTAEENSLQFTRTSGGEGDFPFLLGPGTAADGGDTITLLYGDEGPGSDQRAARFSRQGG